VVGKKCFPIRSIPSIENILYSLVRNEEKFAEKFLGLSKWNSVEPITTVCQQKLQLEPMIVDRRYEFAQNGDEASITSGSPAVISQSTVMLIRPVAQRAARMPITVIIFSCMVWIPGSFRTTTVHQ
jgi:hypothetical protein